MAFHCPECGSSRWGTLNATSVGPLTRGCNVHRLGADGAKRRCTFEWSETDDAAVLGADAQRARVKDALRKDTIGLAESLRIVSIDDDERLKAIEQSFRDLARRANLLADSAAEAHAVRDLIDDIAPLLGADRDTREGDGAA